MQPQHRAPQFSDVMIGVVKIKYQSAQVWWERCVIGCNQRFVPLFDANLFIREDIAAVKMLIVRVHNYVTVFELQYNKGK